MLSAGRKASHRGAFFVAGGLLLVVLAASAQPPCAADRIDHWVQSEHVYDGDTLRTGDGRRVRLLGIDTPEIGHDGRPSDPFARKAQQALQRLAGPGTRIGLRYGDHRQDRHGRTLAHVFTADGQNVQALLLAQGLAATLVVPPNEWQAWCYHDIEQAARETRRGMWSHPRYQAKTVEAVVPGTEGYHVVTGQVRRVGEGGGALWLELSPGVAVRIPLANLEQFDALDVRALAGRHITVRGWVYTRRGQRRIAVRHPSALELN